MTVTRNNMLYAFAAVCSVVGGVLIGVVDLHASEVVMTLVLVFALCMVLGAIAPRGGWYWSGLSILGVPLVNLFPAVARTSANPHLPRTVPSYLLFVLLLLTASLPGMLFGVIVRRTIHVAKQ